MRKYKLDNLYESSLPLENINNLWADVDENTGRLRAIHKYNKSKGEWEPDMVSVEYISTPDDNIPQEIVYHSANTQSWGSVYTLKDTDNNYKHHCLVISDWENLPESGKESTIRSEPMKRGSTLVSIYDRDWSSSTNIKWIDNMPIINGATYKLVKGVFGHFAGSDGFEHRFYAMSPAQYEQFKTGMTVSTSTSDKFDAILIIELVK